MKNYKEYTAIKKEVKQYYNNLIKDFKKQVAELKDIEELKKNWYITDNLTTYQLNNMDFKTLKNKAIDKFTKKKNKDLQKYLDRADEVAACEVLKNADIEINWSNNRTWGYNPQVECRAWDNNNNYKCTCGSASGCGYDKRSAATAEAFNANNSILKILYNQIEAGLRKGLKNTHDTCGYGCGHLPFIYFEGGVGFSSHKNIFEKAGYTVSWHEGKTWDSIQITRK